MDGVEIRLLTSNFKTLGLDVLNNFYGSLGDVIHIFAMAMLSKKARCADDDVEA